MDQNSIADLDRPIGGDITRFIYSMINAAKKFNKKTYECSLRISDCVYSFYTLGNKIFKLSEHLLSIEDYSDEWIEINNIQRIPISYMNNNMYKLIVYTILDIIFTRRKYNERDLSKESAMRLGLMKEKDPAECCYILSKEELAANLAKARINCNEEEIYFDMTDNITFQNIYAGEIYFEIDCEMSY